MFYGIGTIQLSKHNMASFMTLSVNKVAAYLFFVVCVCLCECIQSVCVT